ncbi:unnamed protein product [Brassica napus]|uniref:(rape) hypothetical protein n=2 Tax=Brassica TaxID=3705 RepID=A0A816ZDL5_BRANA|nr:unnamed protein product [Brassica napus]
MDFSSPSPPMGSGQSPEALMEQVQAQLQQAYAEELIETLRGKCFDKCVTKPGSSLSSGESSCVSRCVDRYIEAMASFIFSSDSRGPLTLTLDLSRYSFDRLDYWILILHTSVLFKMFRRKTTSQAEQENNEAALREAKIKEVKTLIGELSGRSSLYCSDPCLKRYLEARNWNVGKAKKMLEETLKWRSTFKPEEIRWDEVSGEGETGKVYKAGFHDRSGRTVLILRPGLQNTKSLENQMKHLVYLIENAIMNLPEDQEQMSWLIDFTDWSLSTSVPIKSARETINILQNHYPERLAVAFLYNPPRLFEAFWKIVKYFIDAKTFIKVKFVYPKNPESVELMSSFFDEENLPTEFGGKALLQYNHEEFSKQMNQDDVKTADFWGLVHSNNNHQQQSSSGFSGAEIAPEPIQTNT